MRSRIRATTSGAAPLPNGWKLPTMPHMTIWYRSPSPVEHAASELVLRSARAARCRRRRPRARGEFHSALADPSRDACWISDGERVIGKIARDHGARTHERIAPDRAATHDGAVRAERGAALHDCLRILIFARHVAAWVDDVGEHHGRTAEHGVSEADARIDR